jgi:tetratricopeptide (TPR) repeat protein
MEYLEGITLQELIGRNSLSLLEKVEIMSEVADGLHYAHERGVTHRDVKPANIMRLADGSVKIMDFGIARIASEVSAKLTQTGFLVGSLMYMAPEQFNGTSDALSDIFSYGVTFYELFCGRNPFSSPDPAAVMYRIINTDPTPVRSLANDCPEALDRIVRRTIRRPRETRYSSMSDVAADVRPLLLDLRREQGGKIYAEAEQLLAADQLDAAKSAVRRVLELDPIHAGARRLRSEIEETLHRRDSTVRAMLLIERAEEEMRKQQNDEAISTLNVVRQLGLSDPQVQLRLEETTARIEQARRCERLLNVAQDDLRNHNLTEAFRAASEALASDPESIAGKNLLQEIRNQMTSRDAERRLHDEIVRAEGLLLIGETDKALASITEIESRHPQCAEASTLRARAAAQKAEDNRARRLAAGLGRVKSLLRSRDFEAAISSIDALLIDFAGSMELQALRKHAWERLAAMRHLDQMAKLRTEAAALIERQEFDVAIHALKVGVEKLGDTGDLTQMLQRAVAGKAAQEQDREPRVQEAGHREGGRRGAPLVGRFDTPPQRVNVALWATGGVLAAFGILIWALRPSPPPFSRLDPATPLTASSLRVEQPIGPDSVTRRPLLFADPSGVRQLNLGFLGHQSRVAASWRLVRFEVGSHCRHPNGSGFIHVCGESVGHHR